MATIPTNEGGVGWVTEPYDPDEPTWMHARAPLDDRSLLSVSGNSLDGGMNGEWGMVHTLADGTRHSYGFTEPMHIRKAMRTLVALVSERERRLKGRTPAEPTDPKFDTGDVIDVETIGRFTNVMIKARRQAHQDGMWMYQVTGSNAWFSEQLIVPHDTPTGETK